MKGLIFKDLLCMRKSARSYLFVAGIYMLITVVGAWNLNLFAVFLVVLISMMPFSCFSYDNAAKWEVYGLALPVSRRQTVLARYLLLLIVSMLAAGLTLLLGLILSLCGQSISWEMYLAGAAGALLGGILLNAVLLPLLYRFGAERARVLFYGVLGAFVLIIIAAAQFLDGFSETCLISPPPAVLAAVAVLVLAISYFASVRAYERREF